MKTPKRSIFRIIGSNEPIRREHPCAGATLQEVRTSKHAKAKQPKARRDKHKDDD